jgi:hypothetical protein
VVVAVLALDSTDALEPPPHVARKALRPNDQISDAGARHRRMALSPGSSAASRRGGPLATDPPHPNLTTPSPQIEEPCE